MLRVCLASSKRMTTRLYLASDRHSIYVSDIRIVRTYTSYTRASNSSFLFLLPSICRSLRYESTRNFRPRSRANRKSFSRPSRGTRFLTPTADPSLSRARAFSIKRILPSFLSASPFSRKARSTSRRNVLSSASNKRSGG